MRKKRGKMRKKKGKITPTPSTPTPLRTSNCNSKNASEMRQKCVRNASKWGLLLLGKEERPKCVRLPSKLRQKYAEHLWGRTPFGRYRISGTKKQPKEDVLLGGYPADIRGLRWALSGPLNRLNAILSLLHPVDRYRTHSAIGSAIGRPLSRIQLASKHRCGSPQPPCSKPLRGLNRAIVAL